MIELKAINKKYNNQIIFNKFSYQFESGFSYAIIGKSGSGKSTLLSIIGLIEPINSGEIIINNTINPKIDHKDGRVLLRNKINYLFQSYGFIEDDSIFNNLNYALKYKKLSKKTKEKLMKEKMNEVDLVKNLKTKVNRLSGGEKQRLALARNLINYKPILLCDEPTSSLDDESAKKVEKLIFDYQKTGGIIIIATHNLELARKCDFILDLNVVEK